MKLREIAYSRSGDKGDVSNICVFVDDPADYLLIVDRLTAERVRAHFGGLVEGDVVRYELSERPRAQLRPRPRARWWGFDDAARRPARQVLPVARPGHGGLRCSRRGVRRGDGVRRRPLVGRQRGGVCVGRPELGAALRDVAPRRRRAGRRGGRRRAGGVRALEPHRTGERAAVLRRFADLLEKHHEELAQLVTTEVGSPISLARTLQTATPVTNLRWAADVAESGPRGGRERLPASGGAAACRERAAPGADRGGRRGDAVQLPGQHDRLEGRPRAGRRLHRRPAAVAARDALLRGCRPAGRGGRGPARCPQPRARRPGRRTAAERPSRRRPRVVHRIQRHRSRRCRGSRAVAHEGRPRARRQVADRGPPGCRPRAPGPSMLRSAATPARAVARRRGSSCTAASTTSSWRPLWPSCATGCRSATLVTRGSRSAR